MTWLYLLKERSKVSNVIEFFFNKIKNQFSTSIRVLYTDNALEYVKKDVSSFCSKIELFIRPLILIYLKEMKLLKKHRYIMNVARTLMIHMSVLKYLWSDDVLSTCYLINRMPSSVLNNKSPFSCLYVNKTPFSMTPCVFECTCFVQDLSPGLDKLSPRSIKYVFIGYFRTKKGYMCYTLSTRKYLVSTDVTFFE